MNSLELVQRLYEGELDLDALNEELDESSREELRQLIAAREALESLPRRKPSPRLVDAVVSQAVHVERRQPLMTLVLANRTLQRLAAAAVVVVAVGVGYLALRTEGLIPVQKQDLPSLATETPAETRVMAPGGETEESLTYGTEAFASGARREGNIVETPPAAEPMDEMAARAVPRGDAYDMAPSVAAQAKERKSEEAELAFALRDGDDALAPDSALLDESEELLSWDQEEEALRTFFWQVRALDGRSPVEEWEEAVPLEGSFEQLEKQRPGSNRWLETGSER